MSDVSDEDDTWMLTTCLQQVVRVVLVDFEERRDTRTNGQHYTAADRRPTNWACRRGYLEDPREKTAFVEIMLQRPQLTSAFAAANSVTSCAK